MTLRTRVPAALSVLLAASLCIAPLAAHADEPTAEPTAEPTVEPGPAVVTFPEDTTIQPQVDRYVVMVDAPAYDEVLVSARSWSTRAPATGSVEVVFPYDGPVGVVVSGCVADVCEEIARGPEVVVMRSLQASAQVGPGDRLARDMPVALGFPSWALEDLEGEVDWELFIEGASVASGSTTYARRPGAEGVAEFVPTGVPDGVGGSGWLQLWLSDDVEGFGPLRQEITVSVEWDDRVEARLKVSQPEFYPLRDRYLDNLNVLLLPDELLDDGRIEVADADGVVVRTLVTDLVGSGTWTATWNGRGDDGAYVPAGEYTVRAVLTDAYGNTETFARPVLVHGEQLVREVWKKTFRAADTVIDTAVGRCSDYRTPSSRRDRGSFQLASQTRCRRADQSHAIALSGVYLPESVKNYYKDVRVTMRGGPSRGTKNAYAVLAFPTERDKLDARTVLRGRYGSWTIDARKDGPIVRKEGKAGRRYVLWQAGLSEGSRWDVESYTVRVAIKVLR